MSCYHGQLGFPDKDQLLTVGIQVNSGVTSAYLDVDWDNDAINDAMGLTHTSLLDFFPEGTINDPISQVTDFGGSDRAGDRGSVQTGRGLGAQRRRPPRSYYPGAYRAGNRDLGGFPLEWD